MQTFSSKTRKNSRRSSPSARSIAVACVLALCGFLALMYVRGAASAAASFVFSPILAAKTWFLESSGRVPSYFRTQHALIDEVRSLEEQLRERDGDALVSRHLQAENDTLGALLENKKEATIAALVIARPNQTPYDTFLIDRGYSDGVSEGAIVYTEGTIAAGDVIRTYAHSALVRLASSPGVHATAYILGPNIFTETEGMGGGVLRVAVPQGIPLTVGDLVILPAAGAGVYGEVVSIESSEASPEQYGYVTSPVPLSAVRFVSVAKEAQPTVSYEQALSAVRAASTTPLHISVPDQMLVGTSTATSTALEVPAEE